MVNKELELTEKERKLIKYQREVKWGKITVHIENGQPVRITDIKKNIKL